MATKKTTPVSVTEDSPKPAVAKKAIAKKSAAKKAAATKAPAKKAAAPASAATARPAGPARDEIAKAAYLNYRGRKEKGEHGDAHGDWLDAESRLKGK